MLPDIHRELTNGLALRLRMGVEEQSLDPTGGFNYHLCIRSAGLGRQAQSYISPSQLLEFRTALISLPSYVRLFITGALVEIVER